MKPGGGDAVKKSAAALCAGVLFLLLLLRPAAFTEGVRTGLQLCAAVVIPSLFPFTAAATLAVRGKLPRPILRLASPLMRRLRQPPESAAILLLAMAGGYPVGAQAIGTALQNGSLTAAQAERLQCVCLNAGVGFTVNAVGAALLGSRAAGVLLFVSVTLGALVLLPLTCLLRPRAAVPTLPAPPPAAQALLVESVAAGARAMLTVCGLVALFSGLGSTVASFSLPPRAVTLLCCLLEVTGGCARAAGQVPLPVLAAVCAFGGLCVHLQVIALAGDAAPPLPRFYFFRLLHAALAAGVSAGLVRLFPQATAAFAQPAIRAEPWSGSAPAAVSLLILSALVILDLDTKKRIW